MNFLRFLISRVFFKNLLLAILITVIIVLAVLLWLKIYTHHGQAITVPDFSGLTIDEIEDVTSSRELRYEIIDSIFSNTVPRGTAVKQNPVPNSKVKKNRKIFLTMNAVNPEMVYMPQLVGISIRQARLAIENSGLKLGQISYRPDYAVNNVLQQLHGDTVIKEGSEIPKGAKIDLVLGMGLSGETTRIPNLIGLSLEPARGRITDNYLNIGAITFDETVLNSEDSASAVIWRQYPEFDPFSRLNMGLEIDVWLTTDTTLLPLPDSTLFDDVAEREYE
ncbi:MAG: PASTA domain-containing protein [Bacteroidales bacterium]|nr:PASTA domain-containing protein [Bacteroidales bacterium]MBN2698206.1 PASTA domain-containing protein [Bacteroidales bacterium]